MLLVKNPQFLSNQADILPKLPIHELVILTKWRNDRVKIVDFFQRDSFWAIPIFCYPYFIYKNCSLYLMNFNPTLLFRNTCLEENVHLTCWFWTTRLHIRATRPHIHFDNIHKLRKKNTLCQKWLVRVWNTATPFTRRSVILKGLIY